MEDESSENALVQQADEDSDIHQVSESDESDNEIVPEPDPPAADPTLDSDRTVERNEVYSVYKCSPLLGAIGIGSVHPGVVVETACLANVKPPQTNYKLAITKDLNANSLSAVQMEAVLLACAKHQIVNDGRRLGFLIGDGPGVGKGRMMASIIWENFELGRRTSLWVSVSTEMETLARKDLDDIGANLPIHLVRHNKKWEQQAPEGVLFLTYSSLARDAKRVIKFLGDDFDGVIGLDECHRAKNLEPTERKDASQFGLAVEMLQDCLPLARVVYMSATGASEPRHLGYMKRLGLWGPSRPFPNFESFLDQMNICGISAMEFLAMDMKRRGCYIARQLGFQGITVRLEVASLLPGFGAMYNEAVAVWQSILDIVRKKSKESESKGVALTNMTYFWGQHLVFFKQLCIAAKVDRAIRIAKKALDDGQCVIIGLQSTGEACVDRERNSDNYNIDNIRNFASPAASTLDEVMDKIYAVYTPSQGGQDYRT